MSGYCVTPSYAASITSPPVDEAPPASEPDSGPHAATNEPGRTSRRERIAHDIAFTRDPTHASPLAE